MTKKDNQVINLKFYVGITDYNWFITLKEAKYEEVNFWRPGGKASFKALDEGGMFLFKLHSPHDFIVGGGFFLKFSTLPVSLAWEAFGPANGVKSFYELKNSIWKYKKTSPSIDSDPQIGCIILTNCFYFEEEDWIEVPGDWSRNIVQGKTYNSSEYHGAILYNKIQKRILSRDFVKEPHGDRYGKGVLIKPRLGQGSFKVVVTDAYHRRCAITGEKTLPALEAAHIKPYSQNGPHDIKNGILLRRDYHTLFDRGYITIDKDFHILVSHRIHDDYGNGKEYYSRHGSKLAVLPNRKEQLPDSSFLEWHNKKVYLG